MHAGVKPAGKAELVRSLQQQGHCVAMVGDGINDAGALAEVTGSSEHSHYSPVLPFQPSCIHHHLLYARSSLDDAGALAEVNSSPKYTPWFTVHSSSQPPCTHYQQVPVMFALSSAVCKLKP